MIDRLTSIDSLLLFDFTILSSMLLSATFCVKKDKESSVTKRDLGYDLILSVN